MTQKWAWVCRAHTGQAREQVFLTCHLIQSQQSSQVESNSSDSENCWWKVSSRSGLQPRAMGGPCSTLPLSTECNHL